MLKKFLYDKKKILPLAGFVVLLLTLITTLAFSSGNIGESESISDATGTQSTSEEEILSTEPESETESESETETETETETDPKEDFTGMSISPLTGLYVDEQVAKNRPVAVMLNNIKAAVPQSGIASADIIYEAPVEGGITRLMGIFQDYKELKKIGSVRSCRLYYAHIAAEYNAIYAHYGQSKYALSYLNSTAIDNLSGTESVGNTVYFRSKDRKAPHNAYTSGDRILKGCTQKKYRTTIDSGYQAPLSFMAYNETAFIKGNAANKVSVSYSHNSPWFEYDKNTNTYLRYQFGSKQIDDQTGEHLSVTNIIIQFAGAVYQNDEYTLDFTLTGSGTGYYVTGGKYVPITWSRSSLTASTTYYLEDGSELKMTPGKTWVCILQSGKKNSVSIK